MLSKPSPKDIARQHGAEEMEILRQRVVYWRDDYFSAAPPGGGEEYLFLVNEFIQEVEDYLYPYVHRLRVTDHIDQEQLSTFMEFCYEQIYAVRDRLLQGDPSGSEGEAVEGK
jgi:hypothetical protein